MRLFERRMKNLTALDYRAFLMSYSRAILNAISKRAASQQHAVSPQPTSSSFEISVALALYRLPLMVPPMSEVERKFLTASRDIEVERSLKNDYELKMDRDRSLLEKRSKLEAEGKDLSHLDEEIGVSNLQKMKDWEKKGQELMEKYKLNKDFRTCDKPDTEFRRKLDRKLLLLVREKFPSSEKDYASPWILPQLKNNGEPLRQTAERCVGDLFESNVSVRLFGNAPFAHYKYHYPKHIAERTNHDTNYIFFFAAEMLSKSPLPNINGRLVASHKWSTPDEVRNLITLRKYQRCFDAILVE